MLLGIEGMTHEDNMRAIEMLGRHVLPVFAAEAAKTPEVARAR
jgi:hypothetical protein